MSEAERILAIFLAALAALVIFAFINTYAGFRQDHGFRYGYIAGYSEAKANLPSRHQYKESK